MRWTTGQNTGLKVKHLSVSHDLPTVNPGVNKKRMFTRMPVLAIHQAVSALGNPLADEALLIGENGAGNAFVKGVLKPSIADSAVGHGVEVGVEAAAVAKLFWDVGTYVAALGGCAGSN